MLKENIFVLIRKLSGGMDILDCTMTDTQNISLEKIG